MGSYAKENDETKHHAVFIPFPAQGHITPMLKLAKILNSKGFYITFVNTEYNHNRLLRSRGKPCLDVLDDFRFENIPDGLPQSDGDTTQDIPSLCAALTKNFLAPFRDLVTKLNTSSSGTPPVTCVIGDVFMGFTLDVAREFSVPGVLFWSASACGFMAYLHYKHLIQRGLVPLKDEGDLSNGYLDTIVDSIPGMKNMRLKDFPSFIRTTNIGEVTLNYVLKDMERVPSATAVIINTFQDLEQPVLDAMSSMVPPIYTVGPLSWLANRVIPEGSPLASIGSNLWKEDTGCLEWLNRRERSSVVYVNFGSVAVMTNEQLMEFAWGLANSGREFLWVIRPDLVRGDSAVLPPEFLAQTEGRGLLAEWCPQERVLLHPAVGGFLTHGGWNSTLESLCGGVPMLCWPFFAEQQTNCRYLCTEWGVGMEIDNDVKREAVEGLIKELMEGEKGKRMRKKAGEWKECAVRATGAGGLSLVHMEKVVKEVLSRGSPFEICGEWEPSVVLLNMVY